MEKAMKQFNKTLNADITFLKTLHAKKDKREFRMYLLEIQKKHGISRPTVYREMKKDTPGLYKVPNYNPPAIPVIHKEKLMLRELLRSGRTISDIMKIMSKELGIPYNRDRAEKVRLMAEALDDTEDGNKTMFASGGKFFLQELFCLEYMAYGRYAEVHVNGEAIKVTREAFDDIILILTREKPPENEDPADADLREEIMINTKLLDITKRTLDSLSRSGAESSSFAIKNLSDKLKELREEKKALAEKKKYILHKQKLGGVNSFYAEEWLNEPAEYDPHLNDVPAVHENSPDEAEASK
jgi:hypothetical protein